MALGEKRIKGTFQIVIGISHTIEKYLCIEEVNFAGHLEKFNHRKQDKDL
ncbi:MAG: hypothetical protein K9H62_20930 [Bacteroidales bacterium]|nr:hypothetical protein [Bacteroidales bacterium]